MPIYEYLCHSCKHKFTLYLRTFMQVTPRCPLCNENNTQRLFSTFAMHKTDKAIYEDILNDPQLTKGMIHDDPKSLAEWNQRMSRGEKVPPEYEDMIGKMERGEIPSEPGN